MELTQKKKKAYCCQKCGQPKRGHICTVAAKRERSEVREESEAIEQHVKVKIEKSEE